MDKEPIKTQYQKINNYLKKHLFIHTAKAIAFALLLSIIVLGYFYNTYFNDTVMHLWLIVFAVFFIFRMIVSFAGQNNNANTVLCYYLLVYSGIVLGLILGFFYWHYFPVMNLFHRTVMLLFLAGLTAGSTISMAASPLAFIGFVVPIFAPIILRYALAGDSDSLLIASIILLFVLFLLMVYISNWKMLREHVELLIQQQELNKQLNQFNQRLSVISTTDELTQLANRRYFQERLISDWIHSKRTKIPLSLLLIDLDYFKACNDNYGHLYGDECLKLVSKVLSGLIKRRTDLAARFGGDELAVILYDTDEKEAEIMAKAIAQKVEHLGIKNEFSPISRFLTISIGGICIIPQKDDDYIQLLREADKALYIAKKNGRNNIVIRSQEDLAKELSDFST